MTESKIYVLLSLVLVELVSGAVVSVIPDPISAATIATLSNDPNITTAYENGNGWLAVAEKTNDSFRLTKTILQLFFLGMAPIGTTLVFAIRIL